MKFGSKLIDLPREQTQDFDVVVRRSKYRRCSVRNRLLEDVVRRETLIGDLRRRIRAVKQGRDGFLYLLTDEAEGVMLKIEPAE